MFDRLFAFIRQGVKTAIIGGIEDARDELTLRIEADPEPLAIEAVDTTPTTNGRTRKRATAK